MIGDIMNIVCHLETPEERLARELEREALAAGKVPASNLLRRAYDAGYAAGFAAAVRSGYTSNPTARITGRGGAIVIKESHEQGVKPGGAEPEQEIRSGAIVGGDGIRVTPCEDGQNVCITKQETRYVAPVSYCGLDKLAIDGVQVIDQTEQETWRDRKPLL